jgi:hypothetical protein
VARAISSCPADISRISSIPRRYHLDRPATGALHWQLWWLVRLPRPTSSIHHPRSAWTSYAISGDAVPFTQSNTSAEPTPRLTHAVAAGPETASSRLLHAPHATLSPASWSSQNAVQCVRVDRGVARPCCIPGRQAAQVWLMHQIRGHTALERVGEGAIQVSG